MTGDPTTPNPTPTTPPRRRGRTAPAPKFLEQPQGPCRVCIYVRRSTDDEHQPFSLDAQLAALHKYVAGKQNWTIACQFEDDASGATTDRPGLQKAIKAAKSGLYDVLLVYRIDRFSRSVADLLDLITQLQDAKVHFASATEPIDTGGPFGRMMLQLLAVFAEFERNIIIDRVRSGMAAKAAKGKWPGGTRPYGYLVDRDTHKLVPHPDEAPILREIFRLYTSQRQGSRAIATELNSRGIPNRTGKPWAGYTIIRIIDNPCYIGDLAYGPDIYVSAAHDPIIDRETFRRANEIADARGDKQTQRAMSDSDYYLTGLITCPDCGHHYIGACAKGRNRTYRYYTCFNRSRYGSHSPCRAPRLPADELDQAVLQALHDFYSTATPVLTAMIEKAARLYHTTDTSHAEELDTITNQITSTEAAINRYHSAFENGTMDDTTAGPRIRDLRQQLARLQTRRSQLVHDIDDQATAPPPDTLDRVRDYLDHVLTSGTTTERKAAIETLIAKIELTEHGAVPMFKILDEDAALPNQEDGDQHDNATRARQMVKPVGRAGLEPATEGL